MFPLEIAITIPDWAFGKNISVFAGDELLAQKQFRREKKRINGKIEIKEYYLPLKLKPDNGRCNGCGDCCSTGLPFSREKAIDIKKRLRDYTKKHYEGSCPFLDDNGCSLGVNIPFGCARSDCSGFRNCTEKLIELEVI